VFTVPSRFVRAAIVAAIASACAWSAIAYADDEDQGGLQEITVTAQRREQRQQDVGVSVAALSDQQLRDLGVRNAKDIGDAIVGVTFASTAGGSVASNLGIRGVTQTDYSATSESPNSIYVDDVYLASPAEGAFPIYDLARLEVLRGPQGTLFGRASSGGLASFNTQKPTADFNGYVEVGYGQYQDHYVEAAFGGPLTDRIRGRIATRVEKADGYFENMQPGGIATFQKDFRGVRGQLEADVTDSLVARLELNYDEMPRHSEGMYKVVPSYLNSAGVTGPLPANLDYWGTGPGNDYFGYRDPYRSFHQAAFNNIGFFENKRMAPTLYLDWHLGSTTLTSITNFTNFAFAYTEDCDGGPVNNCLYPFSQHEKQWSEELRAHGTVAALSWTAGAFFIKVQQTGDEGFQYPALTGTPGAFNIDDYLDQSLTSYAAFGQLEYSFSSMWRATLGARVTHDDKKFSSLEVAHELGNVGGTGSTFYNPPLILYEFDKSTVGSLAEAKANMVSGKAELDFVPQKDVLVYSSVSRGVKGPGFNANDGGSISLADTPVHSEWLMAYELGEKIEAFNRHARLNTSVFYYDYHDFQAYAYKGLAGLVENKSATFKGAELEASVLPVNGLTLNVGVAYLDTLVKDVGTATRGVLDQQSANAPKWQGNASIHETFRAGPGEVGLTWDGNYIGHRYGSIDNTLGAAIDGSFVHNARVSYFLADSGWEIATFLNNISNTGRMTYAFDLTLGTGDLLRSYAPPRMWGVSVRKTFK
jgi:iron complex outermembrane recepter protein